MIEINQDQYSFSTLNVTTKIHKIFSFPSNNKDISLSKIYEFLAEIKPYMDNASYYILSLIPIYSTGTTITNNIEFTKALMEVFDLLCIHLETKLILKKYFNIEKV